MKCQSGWIKLKARFPGEVSTQICSWYHPNGKEPLDEGVEESEKAGLKLNIQKTKVIASDPITSWQIDGETVETETVFFPLGSKSLQTVTAAMKLKDAYSLEEKLWQI